LVFRRVGAAFVVRVAVLVVRVLLRLVVVRRRRPGMGLPLVFRHGKRRHRRNV
jgi:hypothetical protein